MTDAVEKVAARPTCAPEPHAWATTIRGGEPNLDLIERRNERAREAIETTGLDRLTTQGVYNVGFGIVDDVPALIAEVKRLRVENLTYQQLADHSERIIGELTERAEAAEARNAAALALHDSATLTAGHPLVAFGQTSRRVCISCTPPRNPDDEAWPCATVKALGGETATTETPDVRVVPGLPDDTLVMVSFAGGKMLDAVKITGIGDTGPREETASEAPESHGERRETLGGSPVGHEAESEVPERHMDLSAYDHGHYDETPHRRLTQWRDRHPLTPRRDDAEGGDVADGQEARQ